MTQDPNSADSELKNILDAAGMMIITTDLTGIVRIFNPAAERMLKWSADEVVGRHTPILWHDPAEVADRAAELSHEFGRTVLPNFEVLVSKARDQLNEQRQWTFVRKDGSRIPVLLVMSAIRDVSGKITGYVGTAKDLTARVEAEQQRDRFFNLSLDMLGIANTDGYFKRINPTFRRVLGWADEEFLSRPFLDFIHPDDKAATLRLVETLVAGEPTLYFENRYLCKDGSWRWVAWTCNPQPDGSLYAAGRDITSLKQAEDTLRQTQQDLAITLHSIGDGVLATDANRRITRINPVAEQLTGWPQSEAVGRSIDEVFQIIHEETRLPALIPIDDVLATGTIHGLANHTVLISREGTERPIADSAAPIRGDEGQITGVVLVFRDVASERRFERELQELNADLERRIENRTRTLAASEQRLRIGHRILESMTSDESLEQTLDLIARSAEMEDPSALCSILLLDETGKHLLHGAAPSLPDFYNEAIHGIEIGENVGSCGTAAATKQRVIAEDIYTHPGWTNFTSVAEKAGLRSCWSEPIFADAGQVLGTFAMYHREPRTPDEKDFERIQWAANFVQLAIERKQAQTKLVESERFNRATLDSLSAHVAVLDATGKIVATNQAWRNFAESNNTAWQTVSEGTNYLAVCDQAAIQGDATSAAAAEAIRQTIAGERETWFHEYPCHASDEQRWFFCRVTRFPTNGAVHVVVSHENVTAMKLAEEQLAVSIAQYDSLSRVSPVGIILFDSNGKCTDVNRRWCEMTGLHLEEALVDGWHAAIHQEDRDRVIRQWNAMVQHGQPFHSEHRLRPLNGDATWVICEAEIITNSHGQVTGFVCTLTDLTEHKVTEQALRLLSSDLAKLSGRALYEAITVQLSELIQCEITVVCTRAPGAPDRMVPLALAEDGEIQANLDFLIDGTRFAAILDQGSCIIPAQLRHQYPAESYCVDKRIESLVGVPITGSSGTRLGCLVAMSRRPLRHPERIDAILKLFALSVAADIEKQTTEQRMSDLVALAPDAIVITDRDGIIVQSNRQVTTVFGWTPDELLGQPVEVLIPAYLRAGHASYREQYAKRGLPGPMSRERNDLPGLRKDGSVFPAQVYLSPIKSMDGLLIAAYVRDVSARINVEGALRDANAMAAAVIENVSGLFYVLDQNGCFVRWNQQLRHLLGLTADQMRQTVATAAIHEEDRERIAGEIAEVFTKGHAISEARLLLKDGPRHFLLNGRRLEINGEVYLVGSGIDITERKQAEQDIQLLNQTLEKRVRERTTELSNANAELAKASRSKSEFLTTMSHELRTPLNGILGMNELLLTTELDERQREYVAACSSSGRLLLHLINDILDLSKIEAGKLELDPRECSVEVFTYDVVDIMSHAVRAKNLALTCRIAPEACVTGLFDDARLRQVLVNLVGNAVKFTSSGRITVTVDRVGDGERRSRLRFAVVDTGIGIPAERLDRLFKSFSQVDSSTTRQYGGTGLGLSISKQLIELMGGEIGVESQVGIGTKFWFEIDMMTSQGVSDAEQRKRLLRGTPIIAIDDLDQERVQIADCMYSWGCPFQQVATIDDAITAVQDAIAAGRSAPIVLADCRLASDNKFSQLQELATLSHAFVVGLGAPPDGVSRNQLYRLGFRNLLDDPIRPSVLFDTLAKVLSVTKEVATIKTDSPSPQQPEATLSGHILVAEDNRINQLYITELLTHLGCTSDVAVNGEEALAAVLKQRYNLVLMDCQMPKMDGFAAAREIRKREAAGQLPAGLPIVALTANALKGDRERCLEAGMNEYVSKPVEAEKLRSVLAKYIGPISSNPDSRSDGI